VQTLTHSSMRDLDIFRDRIKAKFLIAANTYHF